MPGQGLRGRGDAHGPVGDGVAQAVNGARGVGAAAEREAPWRGGAPSAAGSVGDGPERLADGQGEAGSAREGFVVPEQGFRGRVDAPGPVGDGVSQSVDGAPDGGPARWRGDAPGLADGAAGAASARGLPESGGRWRGDGSPDAGSGLEPRARVGTAGLAGADAARLTAEERRLREELGSLGAARRAELRAREVAAEVAGLDRQARADEEAIEEAGQWLAGWETARQTHTRRVEAAQDAATRAEQLAGQLAPARQRLEAARRWDVLAWQATEAEQRLLHSREQAAAAHETWLDLKDRRLRGIAAELAAGLSAGEPCAVCGATEHPHPARPGAGHVDR
ncbi:SMC family ATPase, partial [Streptomyces sp. MCAF7]